MTYTKYSASGNYFTIAMEVTLLCAEMQQEQFLTMRLQII
jgi:hypothetical protein